MKKSFLLIAMMVSIVLGLKAATQEMVIDLSERTSGYDYPKGGTLSVSSCTLTGTLASPYYISITDGSTVTLDNVVINGTHNQNYAYAGLTFLGDATIYLKGTNKIKGWYDRYPGIFVAPGKTIHIYADPNDPDASLEASSNSYGAGIGGGYQINCGSIFIHSGKIKATSRFAAAIGSGFQAQCGMIYIYGGDIDARCTDSECSAAAIGTAKQGTVSAIYIKNVDRIYAQGGGASPCSIGCGVDGTNDSNIIDVLGENYASPGVTENPYTSDKIYTEFVESSGKLTYFYGSNWLNSRNTIEFYDQSNPFATRFEGYASKVKSVYIDDSMKNAPLTTLASFFCGGANNVLENVTSINGLSNLNTENVTSMSSMFANCRKLSSIDMSTFNTSNVTAMSNMFFGCNFSSIDLSHFDTRNVKTMKSMFSNCLDLRTIDLTNFDMSQVEDVVNMFEADLSLKTIYCNLDWNSLPKLTKSNGLFFDCTSLKGGNGTSYNSSKIDVSYARPDGGASAPGYFTRKIYTEEDGWLYYDDGNAVTPFGPGSGTFYWAVMYPANTVSSTLLDQIGVFVSGYNTDPISISIREGGKTPKEATEIATTIFSPSQTRGMETVTLSPAVTFDNTKNLWIVLSALAGYPAVVCANTGDPNSRWYSMNGTTWGDLADTYSGGVKNDYSFMVRAHFNDLHEDIDQVPSDKVQSTKVLKDGQLLIEKNGKTYDATGKEVR